MKKSAICIILFQILLVTSMYSNPLLEKFNTPFGVPPFDKIKNEHFIPAFEKALEEHNKEIKAIINNKQEPTFKNTIEAMEYSGELLGVVSRIFYNLNSANTSSELQKIAQEIAPKLSAHSDEILMNPLLFKKVKHVYENKSKFNLNQEQMMLLEDTYKSFIRAGANLNEKDKERLKEINSRLSVLSLQFGQNVLNDVNNYKLIIDKESDLDGLPENVKATAYETAKSSGLEGKWVFTLQNPSVMPFLQFAKNRELRKQIQQAYINRGNNNNEYDNKKIINEIVNLRIEKAKLLGYNTFADYVLEESMAKTPAKAQELLERIWTPALNMAKKERDDMQKLIEQEGNTYKLEQWDWRYYAEKVREAKYNLNEEELKPYFQLENVKKGIFDLTTKLFGIIYKERKDIPKYHEDAIVYEVLDEDGSHLGILYMDFHPRASKRSGAWMTSYRQQYKKDGKNITPVVSLVCNFTKPTKDTPSLLSLDEVETFFHEFGHGLHGLLSNCTYKSLSGTSVPRDFVELPSQIMEHWATHPEMLKIYAKHYKTNEPMPDELIEKLKNSSYFNQGFATVEFVASALLDMRYHTLTQKTDINPEEFQSKVSNEIGLIPEIHYRHASTHFNHIFSGGYSAGYYSYLWSGVLDADAFEAFREKGIFDRDVAKSFRNNILSRGKTEDPMTLYIKFRGKEPSIEPLLKVRGLHTINQ